MDIEDSSTVLETVPEAATQCRDRQKPADTITLEIIRGKLLALGRLCTGRCAERFG